MTKKERARRYRDTHRDDIRAYNKAYELRNRERVRQRRRAWRQRNLQKVREYFREYARNHRAKYPERHRAIKCASYKRNRDRLRAAKYGITELNYLAIHSAQEGKCAICGSPFCGKSPRIDHDHATGIVRGLLCHNCNAGIGLFKDRPELLRSAASYLSAR